MALYAIGDLHLAQSVNKPMDVFGPGWSNHAQRLEAAFSQLGEGDGWRQSMFSGWLSGVGGTP